MRYRVDELAARGGVSVDTVRFYQSKHLLPPPEREGRVAWYSDAHVERLARIRELKRQGFTLTSIKRLLDDNLDADAVLASIVVSEPAPGSQGGGLTLDELAARTGVSTAVLEVIDREGLLTPSVVDGRRLYSDDDAAAIAAGLELLASGLPLGELLELARRHNDAVRSIAEQAVDLFIRFVRDPIHATATTEGEAADRLVNAFRRMLPATTTLVASHFERVLLSVAERRLKQEGLVGEVDSR